MNEQQLKAFALDMIQAGRSLGHVQGLKLAIDILRKHDVPVDHPARIEIYHALMSAPPAETAPAILDATGGTPPRPDR
jgi:hypothetical protein